MKKNVLIIMILSVLIVCLIFSFKEKTYNISSSNGLWYIYDSNLENIENNMNEITESNDEFLWYVLLDFNIEDTEYKDMLNALVARIRMSYYELTQNKDFYTNSNAILNYRDKDNITEKELKILTDAMSRDQEMSLLKNLSNFKISDDEEVSEKFKKMVLIYDDVSKNRLFTKDNPTYEELLSRKIIETNILKDLSDFLVMEYYRLK